MTSAVVLLVQYTNTATRCRRCTRGLRYVEMTSFLVTASKTRGNQPNTGPVSLSTTFYIVFVGWKHTELLQNGLTCFHDDRILQYATYTFWTRDHACFYIFL